MHITRPVHLTMNTYYFILCLSWMCMNICIPECHSKHTPSHHNYVLNHGHLGASYPFMDPRLPWSQRVDDLVGRLTVDELIPQIWIAQQKMLAPTIPRLGIKPYVWDTECLRGQVNVNKSTAFPQSVGLAATFR